MVQCDPNVLFPHSIKKMIKSSADKDVDVKREQGFTRCKGNLVYMYLGLHLFIQCTISLHVTLFSPCPLLPEFKFSVVPMVMI